MAFGRLISHWQTDPETAPNLTTWRTTQPRPADVRSFPPDLPPALARALTERGILSLYSHQEAAWTSAHRGENVVLATGTASGKTLGYNLPVLSGLLANEHCRALYLFPTKALAQDQLAELKSLLDRVGQTSPPALNFAPSIYDGDTPQAHRSTIRSKARLLLSNPDMLHTGILPHHTNWEDFFRNLGFVVIDEMHTYRGVFGSHVANVLRRLKRVAHFYGANPQFLFASATIRNPAELAEQLIEEPVILVDRDGSARGERNFLIYNPPVVDPALGLRKSSIQESVRLAQDLLAEDVQSVVFARSRRSVEILLKYIQEASPFPASPLLSSRKGEVQSVVTAPVICPPCAGKLKRGCATVPSGWSSPPTPSSWASILAGWGQHCSSVTQGPSLPPGSRRAGPGVGMSPLWRSWSRPLRLLTSSWPTIPNTFSPAHLSRP